MSAQFPLGITQKETLPGLAILCIDNEFCQATIAYQGAQVLHYQQKNGQQKPLAPLLWLSDADTWQSGKAIRGGIPFCFPWFGQHPTQSDLPSHGFARCLPWQLRAATRDANGHYLSFVLTDNADTRQLWNYAFEAVMHIELGQHLKLRFELKNCDMQSFEFSFAWHSYFLVEDIKRTQVTGLEQVAFLDQLQPKSGNTHIEFEPIHFAVETDRIYQHDQKVASDRSYKITSNEGTDVDAGDIHIDAQGCDSVVVWNPWLEKTARLGDMLPDAWKTMLCVECGQINQATVTLAAGKSVSYDMNLHRSA